MQNTFNRTIQLTLYDVVQSGTDGSVTVCVPLKATDYTISPFTLEDIDAVDQWIRQTSLDRFIETTKAAKNLAHQDFLELVAAETRKIASLSWTSKDGVKLLSNIDGLCVLISRAIKGDNQLSPEQLKLRMLAKENQEEALKAIKRLDSLDAWGSAHPT